MTLARVTHAPPTVIFFAGRLFGLAAFLALGFMALRIAPRARHTLFVVALLPMALLSAATYNVDSFLLGLSLLAVALLLRSREAEEPSLRSFAVVAICLGAMALCKTPYLTLAPLLLLVPQRAFRSARMAAVCKAGALALIVAAAGAWTFVTRDLKPIKPGLAALIGVSPGRQARWMATHPLDFAAVVTRSLAYAESSGDIAQGVVSNW